MDPREFPTKGNLIAAKNSLALAKQGYDLMDKKRNILIRELMRQKIFRKRSIRHLQEHMHVFREQISSMGLVRSKNLPIRFQSRIRFRFRPEASWERRYHM